MANGKTSMTLAESHHPSAINHGFAKHGPRPVGRVWPAALLFFVLTILLAYPLTAHPAGQLLAAGPDPDLFMWPLAWDVHAFTHQPLATFDANLYYPERPTLAYS